MGYTIISGPLTDNTVWTVGTYYLTENCVLGAYNLTLDCSEGSIIIKTIGNKQTQVTDAGNLTVTNSTILKKAIFTSKNDDSKGDVIAGSSGSPTIGDQTIGYISIRANNTTTILGYLEMWYGEIADDAFIDYGNTAIGQSAGNSFYLTNIIFKYCGLKDGSATDSCFIGQWRRAGILLVMINELSVDSTNRILQTGVMGNIIKFANSPSITIKNCFLDLTCDYKGYANISISVSNLTSNLIIKNIMMKGRCAYIGLRIFISGISAVMNAQIMESIFDMIDKTKKTPEEANRPAINIAGGATGTVNFSIKNSIITNANIGLNKDAIVNTWYEDYNCFYNNIANSDVSLGENSKIVDPQFINLLPRSIINSTFSIPNGYAIGNTAQLEYVGSDTFDNLDIDENVYSPTGKKYVGTDKVTPGINYGLIRFYSPPVINIPAFSIEGLSITSTGQLIFNPNSNTSLWLQNPYVLT